MVTQTTVDITILTIPRTFTTTTTIPTTATLITTIAMVIIRTIIPTTAGGGNGFLFFLKQFGDENKATSVALSYLVANFS